MAVWNHFWVEASHSANHDSHKVVVDRTEDMIRVAEVADPSTGLEYLGGMLGTVDGAAFGIGARGVRQAIVRSMEHLHRGLVADTDVVDGEADAIAVVGIPEILGTAVEVA